MKQNKPIHSRTVARDPMASNKRDLYPDTADMAHEKALRKHDERKRLIAVADQIAKSTHWTMNWKWPGSDKEYPNHPDMRMVTKYYPYAVGGPLLVDEARDRKEAEQFFSKQKILKKLGFRHIVIEHDTSLYDALDQLGEI